MKPGYLCSKLLHNLLVGPRLGEGKECCLFFAIATRTLVI